MHKLRKWRKEHGVSAQTVGNLLGVSKQQIGRIENGYFKLKPEYVLILEKFTGLSRYELRPDIYGRKAETEDIQDLAS